VLEICIKYSLTLPPKYDKILSYEGGVLFMLYHREVFWQPQFDIQSKQLLLSVTRLSNHLYDHIENSNQPRYDINIETLYHIVQGLCKQHIQPFEVEVDDNNKVVKMVVRTSYDDDRDISIVVREGFILTCWLNDKTDLHFSLDTNKYYKPLDNDNK